MDTNQHTKPARRLRPMPRIRCEAEDVADFGYGPNEYHQCQTPATHRGWDWSPFTTKRRERVLLCQRHAQVAATSAWGAHAILVYRFRTLGGAA